MSESRGRNPVVLLVARLLLSMSLCASGLAMAPSVASAEEPPSGDPYCASNYADEAPGPVKPIRFGVNALEGAAPGNPIPTTPEQPAKTMAGLRGLQPPADR